MILTETYKFLRRMRAVFNPQDVFRRFGGGDHQGQDPILRLIRNPGFRGKWTHEQGTGSERGGVGLGGGIIDDYFFLRFGGNLPFTRVLKRADFGPLQGADRLLLFHGVSFSPFPFGFVLEEARLLPANL